MLIVPMLMGMFYHLIYFPKINNQSYNNNLYITAYNNIVNSPKKSTISSANSLPVGAGFESLLNNKTFSVQYTTNNEPNDNTGPNGNKYE